MIYGLNQFQEEPKSIADLHLHLIDFSKIDDVIDIGLKLLKLPEKTYAQQYEIVERILKKIDKEEDRNKVLSILAQKLSNVSLGH